MPIYYPVQALGGATRSVGCLPVRYVLPALLCISYGVVPQVSAAERSEMLDEIVVTAQRRNENLQDVPIAISAITSEDLSSRGITQSLDLGQVVPGLTINAQSGYFFPRIRGVGNNVLGPGFENGVATYVDGVYYASTPAGFMSLRNIERIEVLKGPQGTLFGRNTTGGLIQVVTRTPEAETSGEISLGYGNYQTVTADAYATTGITEDIAMDFAGHIVDQGEGYGENIFTGDDVYKIDTEMALRSSVLMDFSEETTLRLSADYSKSEGSMFARTPAPGTLPVTPILPLSDDWDVSHDYQPFNRFEDWGASARLDHDLGVGILNSITAYREVENFSGQDADSTQVAAANVKLNQDDWQFSQELHLSSSPEESVFWIVGAYYFYAESEYDPARIEFFGPARPPTPFGPLAANLTYSELETESLAGFAQATMPLTDATNVTLGLRYTSEERSIDATTAVDIAGGPQNLPGPPIPSQSERFSKLTWRFVVDHHLSEDLMAYASYNRGFKSGGFNGSAPTSPAFEPEVLDAFEVGAKSSLFADRLRLNMAAFYYDYEDIQVTRFLPGQTVIFNGAGARVFGLDADFEARLTENFGLSGGISVIDDEFTDFPEAPFFLPLPNGGNQLVVQDGEGNHLPQTSEFTGFLSAEYNTLTPIGDLLLVATYSYNDGYYPQYDNVLRQDSYGLLNASATLSVAESIDLRIWARNISDEAVTQSIVSSPLNSVASYLPPRTYGAEIKFRF